MKSLSKIAISLAVLSTPCMALGAGQPLAFNGEELAAMDAFINTIETWAPLSRLPSNLIYAGDLKFQFEVCGFRGCEPYQDMYVTIDDSDIIADRPIAYDASLENPSPNPYHPRRGEFIEALDTLFKNPDAVRMALQIGNRITAATYETAADRGTKLIFVLSKVGPWMPNQETGLLVIRSNAGAHYYHVVGQ